MSHKTRTVSRLFHSHWRHLLALYWQKWQISHPFHVLQWVKSLGPLDTPEAWKRCPFWVEPPNIGPPCWASSAQIQRILLIVTHWFKNWFCYRDAIFTSMGRYRDPPLPIQTTMQSKYSGTSTLGLLFSRETSIHETQNLVLEKCSHINLCTCYPWYEGTPLFKEKWHLS